MPELRFEIKPTDGCLFYLLKLDPKVYIFPLLKS
jgi:hypothetical protein